MKKTLTVRIKGHVYAVQADWLDLNSMVQGFSPSGGWRELWHVGDRSPHAHLARLLQNDCQDLFATELRQVLDKIEIEFGGIAQEMGWRYCKLVLEMVHDKGQWGFGIPCETEVKDCGCTGNVGWRCPFCKGP